MQLCQYLSVFITVQWLEASRSWLETSAISVQVWLSHSTL